MDVTNDDIAHFLNRFAGIPFEWGKFDCANFFVECVKFLTGEDHSAAIEGKWQSKYQAVKFFTKTQFSTYIEDNILHLKVGLKEVKTGDLCVLLSGQMETVGMIYGEFIVVMSENTKRLAFIPIEKHKRDIIQIVRLA